jgi:hypothetical protein
MIVLTVCNDVLVYLHLLDPTNLYIINTDRDDIGVTMILS